MKTAAQLTAEVCQLRQEIAVLTEQAERDALTGLHNHCHLKKLITKLQENSTAYVVVALIDIDCFKNINDQHGHAVGDKALCQAAEILKKCCRKSDTICRQGGDEFLLILSDITADKVPSAIRQLTTKLNKASIEMTTLGVSFSFGVTSGVSNKVNQLIIRADRNMYQHKTGKRGKRYHTFSDVSSFQSMPMKYEFMG